MDEDEPAIVSGDKETIVITPESIELLFDIEDPGSSEEDCWEDLEVFCKNLETRCYVTPSGEVLTVNDEDIVQAPFDLESYFMDKDELRSRMCALGCTTEVQPEVQQLIVEINRVTCYQCDIVFCNEHRLLEHLMTHIDIYTMGCEVCDKVSFAMITRIKIFVLRAYGGFCNCILETSCNDEHYKTIEI